MTEIQKVRVFFSCSGKNTLSHKVAESFRKILPDLLLDAVEPPYIFTHDLQPGVWYQKLMETIAHAEAGIIFITHENRFSPWIIFEAGAIAGGIGENSLERVMPLLIDLTSADLQTDNDGRHCGHPLEHSTQYHCDDQENLFSLVKAIGNICKDAGTLLLTDHQLERHFEGKRPEFDSWYQMKLQPILLGTSPLQLLSISEISDDSLRKASRDGVIKNIVETNLNPDKLESNILPEKIGETGETFSPRIKADGNRLSTQTTKLPKPPAVNPPSPAKTSRSSGLADRLGIK